MLRSKKGPKMIDCIHKDEYNHCRTFKGEKTICNVFKYKRCSVYELSEWESLSEEYKLWYNRNILNKR